MTSDLEKKLGPIYSKFTEADEDRVRDTFKQLHRDGKLVYNGGDSYFTNMREEEHGWTGDEIDPSKAAEILMSAYNFDPSTAPTDPGVESQSTDTTQTTTGPVPAVETTTTGDDNMTHDDTTTPRATPVTPVEADSLLDQNITRKDVVKLGVTGALAYGAYLANESGLVDMVAAAPEGLGAVAGYFLAERFGNKRGFGTVGSIATRVAGTALGAAAGNVAELAYHGNAAEVATIVGASALAGVGVKYRSNLANVVEAVAGGAWGVAKGAWNHKGKIALGVVGAGSIALCAGYGSEVAEKGSNFVGSAWDKVTGLFAHEEQADGEVSMYEDTLRELAAVGGEYEAIKETLDKALVQKYTGIEQARNAADTTQSAVWLETCSPAELFGEVLQAPKDDELRATYDAVMADGYKWGAERISEQFGVERLTQDRPCSYTFDNETAGQQ